MLFHACIKIKKKKKNDGNKVNQNVNKNNLKTN